MKEVSFRSKYILVSYVVEEMLYSSVVVHTNFEGLIG